MTPEQVYADVSAWLARQRRRKRRRLRQDALEQIESVARASGGSEGGGGGGGAPEPPTGSGADPGGFTTVDGPFTGGEGGGGGDPGPDGEGGGGGGGDDGGGILVTPVLLVDYVTDPDPEPRPTSDNLIDPGIVLQAVALAAACGMPLSGVAAPTPIGRAPAAWTDAFTDGVIDNTHYDYVGTWSESVVAGEIGPTVAGGGSAGNLNSSALYKGAQYDDVEISAKLANGINSGWSLVIRANSSSAPTNCYAAKFRTTNTTFSKITGGVATNLGTIVTAIAANDVCSIEMIGAAWSVKVNGVEVLSGTDATYASGYAGMAVGSTNTSTRFDDLSISAP